MDYRISFGDTIGIVGIVLAVVLLVLDKAGKLKGGLLFGLLCLAGAMTLFLALGNGFVADGPEKWKFWRGAFLVCLVGFTYSGLAIWISPSAPTARNMTALLQGPAPNEQTIPEPQGIVPLTNNQLKSLIDQLSKSNKPMPPSKNSDPEEFSSDLRFTFYGKDRLYYLYTNPTKHSANKPSISFALMDLTNPYKYATQTLPVGPQPFPIPARVLSDDFVRPGETMGNEEILEKFMTYIKPGEVIYGAAWVTCFNCKKRRGYYLYWKVGEGGWFAEVPLKGMQLPKPVDRPYTNKEIKEYMDKTVPEEKRQPINEQYAAPA